MPEEMTFVLTLPNLSPTSTSCEQFPKSKASSVPKQCAPDQAGPQRYLGPVGKSSRKHGSIFSSLLILHPSGFLVDATSPSFKVLLTLYRVYHRLAF